MTYSQTGKKQKKDRERGKKTVKRSDEENQGSPDRGEVSKIARLETLDYATPWELLDERNALETWGKEALADQ